MNTIGVSANFKKNQTSTKKIIQHQTTIEFSI